MFILFTHIIHLINKYILTFDYHKTSDQKFKTANGSACMFVINSLAGKSVSSCMTP